VEELTREAFWNLNVPGCNEHLLAHKLRDSPVFIPELDFVALMEHQIVGNIMFCRSIVKSDATLAYGVLTFGPVSVLPQFQRQGVGSALIRHSLRAAADLGHKVILIYGDPAYYHRFGFKSAKEHDIATREGKFMDALMAFELYPGVLQGISGRFFEDEVYHVDEEELVEFEKTFPYKEKCITESQRRFQELASQ